MPTAVYVDAGERRTPSLPPTRIAEGFEPIAAPVLLRPRRLPTIYASISRHECGAKCPAAGVFAGREDRQGRRGRVRNRPIGRRRRAPDRSTVDVPPGQSGKVWSLAVEEPKRAGLYLNKVELGLKPPLPPYLTKRADWALTFGTRKHASPGHPDLFVLRGGSSPQTNVPLPPNRQDGLTAGAVYLCHQLPPRAYQLADVLSKRSPSSAQSVAPRQGRALYAQLGPGPDVGRRRTSTTSNGRPTPRRTMVAGSRQTRSSSESPT